MDWCESQKWSQSLWPCKECSECDVQNSGWQSESAKILLKTQIFHKKLILPSTYLPIFAETSGRGLELHLTEVWKIYVWPQPKIVFFFAECAESAAVDFRRRKVYNSRFKKLRKFCVLCFSPDFSKRSIAYFLKILEIWLIWEKQRKYKSKIGQIIKISS